jgi:hypothetical protein
MKKLVLLLIFVIRFSVIDAAAPTIQASGINFPKIGCNAFEINWTNGNGSNRIVAVYPAGGITLPTIAYAANQIYNSGGAIGGGKVVYDGTGNSVIAVGLAANTTYTIIVFEYNAGPAYLTTTTNSVTVTTDVTCTCPVMTGAVINGCGPNNSNTGSCPGGCGEGDSEILLFNSSSYGFVTNSSASDGSPSNTGNSIPFMNYSSAGNANIADAVAYTSNAALTTTLNGMTGCANSFIDASAGAVPPWSTVMMVKNTFCASSYTLTSLCSFAPIYVLYVNGGVGGGGVGWAGENTAVSGCAQGNFSNGAGSIRYFDIDFTKISTIDGGASSASCEYYYSYNWGSSSDGDGIYFSGSAVGGSSTGTAVDASGISTGACNLPVVLPIKLINFRANRTQDGTNINWTTVSEANNDYFEVEYSLDATNFIPYKEVKGAGNSTNTKNYSCSFTLNVGNNAVFFRLKQVDYNGNFSYSSIISVGGPLPTTSNINVFYNTEKDKIVTRFHLDYPQEVNISLYDVTGAKIQGITSLLYSEGDNEIPLNAPDKAGIYILVYQNGSSLPIHQKIMVTK